MKVGIDSCHDLFEKLKFEKSRLEKEWNEYDFFNFVVTAWHLQNDWLASDKIGRPTLAMRKINQAPPIKNEVMKNARENTNGSKHFKLDQKNENNKVVVKIHGPEIRDWHSYFFGPKYGISTQSSYYSTSDFIFIIYEYFAWVFDDNTSAKSLPEKIQKHLEYCTQLGV